MIAVNLSSSASIVWTQHQAPNMTIAAILANE